MALEAVRAGPHFVAKHSVFAITLLPLEGRHCCRGNAGRIALGASIARVRHEHRMHDG